MSMKIFYIVDNETTDTLHICKSKQRLLIVAGGKRCFLLHKLYKMSNDTKWYWILDFWYSMMPTMLLIDKRLSDKQRLLYCLISALAKNEDKCCRASDEYLWECLQCWRRTVNTWIKKLIELWYLIKESDQKWKRTIRLSSIVYWIEVDEDRFPRVCITKEEMLNKWENEDEEKEKIKSKDDKKKKKNKDWEGGEEIKEENNKEWWTDVVRKKYWKYVELSDKEYKKLIYLYWETRFEDLWSEVRMRVHSRNVDEKIKKVNQRINENVEAYKKTWKKKSKSRYALMWYDSYYRWIIDRFDREGKVKYKYCSDEEKYKMLLNDKSWFLAIRFGTEFKWKIKELVSIYRNSLWDIETHMREKFKSEWKKIYVYNENDRVAYDTDRDNYNEEEDL